MRGDTISMSEEKNNVDEETDNTTKNKSSTFDKTDGTNKDECSISKWYCNANETNNSINQYYKEPRIQARGLLLLSILICAVGVVLFVLCINSSVQENKVHVSIVVFGMICGIVMQLVAGEPLWVRPCAQLRAYNSAGGNPVK